MTTSTAQLWLRRLTVHVVPSGDAPPPGARIDFGDDPVATAHALAPGLALRPHDVLTEFAALDRGEVSMHIDRIVFAEPTRDPEAIHHALRAPDALRPTAVDLRAPEPVPAGRSLRRFASYGLVTDPAGRILLTHIAPGFPGAGTWHLPGGGTDHGERARDALAREVWEESGQHATIADVRTVHHHHVANQIGPDGLGTVISAVWVILRAHVAAPTPARVVETHGSTDRSAWFDPSDIAGLPLSAPARSVLGGA